jgi:hypothetical protein
MVAKRTILNILKYVAPDAYDLIGKDVEVVYNGGEKWNANYTGSWHDIYIPISLPKHKICTKNDMKNDREPELLNLEKFSDALSQMVDAIGEHYKVYDSGLSQDKDRIVLCVSLGG